ncbi:MarR family winged helix-turn-helix transcriptional regulator [Gordonia shandongensis]|uniref:MarR family winged helix-turn-helix transcriptional regulator n=1 Tax=Gordonia shandongensis TaxID=376351 RepID=UPI0005586F3B|nr:MarR family winged helix-turn-helix transcriptional regulator [Gordonia shandongensis]
MPDAERGTAEDGSAGPSLTPEQREMWSQFVGGGWILYRALFREIDRGSTLSTADWRLLEVLVSAPKLRISDLADATQIGLSTVSRQVSRFLERGYAVRVESQEDGRQKWVAITDAGREAVAPTLAARDRAVRRLIVDALEPEHFRQLCAAFATIGDQILQSDEF